MYVCMYTAYITKSIHTVWVDHTGKNVSDNCITKCVKIFLEHFYSFKFADLKGGDAGQTASGHLSVKVALHFMVKALLTFSG